jgi:hypothetical protein
VAAEQAGRQATVEAAQQASKEAAEQTVKQAAAQATQQAGKEAAEQVVKQAAEETTHQTGKEAAEQAGKQAAGEATQRAGKESAEQAGGQALEEAAQETVKEAARPGGVVLKDAVDASASGVRNRVVFEDRLVAPGQWKDGNILLSRSAIREVAKQTGNSVRRVLYDTAYHERFHGAVEPIAKRVSKWLGVDDIYEASQVKMLYGRGRGWWYRAEEGAAEFVGRFRGFLRDKWGWRWPR